LRTLQNLCDGNSKSGLALALKYSRPIH